MGNTPKPKGLLGNRGRTSPEAPEKTLACFSEWLLGKGYARRTAECYLFDAGHFARWLGRELASLAPADLAKYQSVLAARPGRSAAVLCAQTRAHVLSAMKALGKFLLETGRAKENPALGIEPPRCPRKLPDNLLTVREVERILAVPRLDDPVGLRNRALLELLYGTGLRQQEALSLRLSDVDLAQGEVRVERGKGGDGRIVPLPRETAAVLTAYLSEARPKLAKEADSGHFFLSGRGGKPDPSRLLKTMKKYAREAGITRPVGFHTWRHSMATHLLQRGASLRHIQEILGHRTLSATQIYTKVTIGDLKRVHAKFHPRERMEV